MDERLGVEARPPGRSGIRIDGDRGVHAADLGPELGHGRFDQFGRARCKQQMGLGLGPHVDAGMEMEEMGVHRGRHLAGLYIDARCPIVERCPDRHAAPFGATTVEIVGKAHAVSDTALGVGQERILDGERGAVLFEHGQVVPCRQNIRCEQRDVLHRAGQQRRDDLFRNPGRAVLAARESVSRDQRGRAARPGLELKADATQMIAVGVEVEDGLEELRRNDRAKSSRAERLRIPIDEALIGARDIAGAKLHLDELEETSRAVERLTHGRGRKPWPIARQIDVEARVEIGAHDLGDRRVVDRPKMHRHMTAARVLPEHRRPEVPGRIVIAGEIAAIEAGPQRHGDKHGTIITAGHGGGVRCGGGRHARASGGR